MWEIRLLQLFGFLNSSFMFALTYTVPKTLSNKLRKKEH
jgi:hypothetical protein